MTTEAVSVRVTDVPASPCAPIVLERHPSFEEVRDVEPEWDSLVEAAEGDVYATFAWCRTWWMFYGEGRRLAVFLFRQNGRLAGIFPFFFETVRLAGCPVRVVRLVGCDHSVTTCHPVIEPGLEGPVLELLAEELAHERLRWDVLQLGPLPGYARRTDELESAVREHFGDCRVKVRGNECHTVFDLPCTYDAYLACLSRNERQQIRRQDRHLQEHHTVKYLFHTEPTNLTAALGRFTAMHEAAWHRQGKLGHFRDWPKAKAFHKALVAALSGQGRVYIRELVLDDQVVGGYYGFVFGKVVHWFLNARVIEPGVSHLSVGRLGFLDVVRQGIESGARMVDGLGGYYEYKLRLGGRLTEKRTILVLRQDGCARVRRRLFHGAAWALDKAYYRVWFARLGPRLRLLRGPLWEPWIRTRGLL